MGQPQPGLSDLHRVLWDPPQPGHPPLQGALSGPGRLARGAHSSAGCHWQPHGQQHLGELHPGPGQAHGRLLPVSTGALTLHRLGSHSGSCSNLRCVWGFVHACAAGLILTQTLILRCVSQVMKGILKLCVEHINISTATRCGKSLT